MSGWDEGNVYFTDQGQAGDRPADGITPGQARRKFADFFRNFRGAPTAEFPDGRLVYRDRLDQDQPPAELVVLMDDVIAHDAELGKELRGHPDVYVPVLEQAAVATVESLRDEAGANPQENALVAGVGGHRSEFAKLEIQVHLTSNETPRALRSMNSKDVSKLVYVPGIVIAASKTKSKATRLAVQCKTCRSVKHLQLGGGYSGASVPRVCDGGGGSNPDAATDGGCGMDPFVVVPEKSKFMDQQTLKLQENPEDVPAGEMPRNVALCVERNLVQRVVPGTRVVVMGIYSLSGGGGGKGDGGRGGGGGASIQQPYLRVVGLVEESEGARGDAHFTDKEHAEFKAFAARPFREVIGDIRARVAPAIFGSDDIKAAVASLLFSGSRKTTTDGARLRGDVNVLLMGDPSTAKSQFLKFVHQTAPICVYTSGKGSSAAGLTASVIKDGNGEFMLTGGAMVLADGGCVCIDEFDKMRDEDRVAIHEAMEQQTISIAKAGITTVLNSRAAVLAAANPPSVRHEYKTTTKRRRRVDDASSRSPRSRSISPPGCSLARPLIFASSNSIPSSARSIPRSLGRP
jgi:DNA replication licensing factor MCM5